MNIYVSPEEVRDLSARLSRIGEDLDALINNMQVIIADELPPVMGGQTCDSYIAQFEDLKPGFVKSRQLVEDISIQLNEIVTGYENTDADMAARVNQR